MGGGVPQKSPSVEKKKNYNFLLKSPFKKDSNPLKSPSQGQIGTAKEPPSLGGSKKILLLKAFLGVPILFLKAFFKGGPILFKRPLGVPIPFKRPC